ncbi:FAD-binding oxidoreductase [Uliginosibacterium gangwonense]|uniref:FAD-binding oxidoreductase n=1 Tax=Uliginosibacterium gangwonense TaxID=392736 RepID=UPI0004768216|nr:FAD-binding oxidoreductase [Uliginosibacterium gangwonense]
MAGNSFIEALSAALPAGRIKIGNNIPAGAEHDWSHESHAAPLAWVAPQSTEEVAATLRVCHAYRIGVVPQGGLTGLTGGANTQQGIVALSLSAMHAIEEIDARTAVAQVQAGVVLQRLQEALLPYDLVFGVDLGPRGSCQIGGLIATNAGGSGVIQYGTTRAQILGLEVVLADGSILPMMRALPKNNSGYDLNQIFIGSEGTLGIITRAILRLHPCAPARHTALLALKDYNASLAVLQHLRAKFPQGIAAFELMWEDYVSAVQQATGLPLPFATQAPLAALLEICGQNKDALLTEFENALSEALDQNWIEDAVIAASQAQTTQLWKLRESVPELFALRQPINFDLSLPISQGGAFVARCRELLLQRWPLCNPLFFGHLGDGNLHIIADAKGLPAAIEADALCEAVYQLLPEFGGAISAEHGIGSLRTSQLRYCRTTAEIAAMRALKHAFDPNNILNPGKVLPAQ